MTSSCSVCPSLMTCKPLGCCYSFAAPPAATTFSGCSPRRLRPSTPAPTTRLFCPPLRTFLAWMAFPTVLDGSPSCPCRWVALAWCLLLRLLSLLIGRLGRIACLSSVSTCRLRRKLSSVTLRLRFRTCRVFALLPQHAPSSTWRTGLPRVGVSSVTVYRRRPCRKTGPPPSFADGKGPRHQLLPAASVSSCSPPCFPSATAGVVALWTPSATIAQPVLGRCPPEPRVPSRAGRRASVPRGRGEGDLQHPLGRHESPGRSCRRQAA